MISEEELAAEYLKVFDFAYPTVAQLLRRCYVKVVHPQCGPSQRNLPYLGIYCPNRVVAALEEKKLLLQEIASYMGVTKVVCQSAIYLLRDRKASLQQTDPRLWLELLWVISQGPEYLD